MSIYGHLLEQLGKDKFKELVQESIQAVQNNEQYYYDNFIKAMDKKEYDIARYYLNKISDPNKKKKAIDKFNKTRKACKPYNESQLLSIIKNSISKLNTGDKLYNYLINYRNKYNVRLTDDYIKRINLIFQYEKIDMGSYNYIDITYAPGNIDQDMRFAMTDYIEPTIRKDLMNSKQFISLNFGDGDEGSFALYDENYDQKEWYE